MRIFNKITAIILTGCLAIGVESCRKDTLYVPPPPHKAGPSATLNAEKVLVAPNSITSPYWTNADYLEVVSSSVSTGNLYGDGMLNMTGTFKGLAGFNNGTDPGLTMKAAYDSNYLYIMAEWTDLTVNPGYANWVYNGPVDALKASESDSAWTSQTNSDRFALAFEINSASSVSYGSFSSVGCQAACHTSGTAAMHPDAGSVDIWNWSLAHSNPLGYVEDMVATKDSLSDDAGKRMWIRNRIGSTDRSGPAYEWDGTSQSVTLANGKTSILDPKFYIYNKTAFKGNAAKGDSIFHRGSQPGECYTCHGSVGQGASETAINSMSEGAESRNQLITNMQNQSDMGPYISGLSSGDFDNLVAYIKGFCMATPGSYLSYPSGSNADITAVSNVTSAQISNAASGSTNKHTKYQVLIIRKLKTGNPDDVQFNLATAKTYKFGVAMMNGDGKNHIGSILETLNFK